MTVSYEYFAPVPRGMVQISSELLQALTRRLPLALVTMSKDKLSLRWTNVPLRIEWPEDIDLSGEPNGIMVSIHVGTAEQRRLLLEAVAEELARASGTLVEFHEQ